MKARLKIDAFNTVAPVYCSMEEKFTFRGETVKDVWESMGGDYWIITDKKSSSKDVYGYARLADRPHFAEWGYINGQILERPTVWKVDKMNWTATGPSDISIEKHE